MSDVYMVFVTNSNPVLMFKQVSCAFSQCWSFSLGCGLISVLATVNAVLWMLCVTLTVQGFRTAGVGKNLAFGLGFGALWSVCRVLQNAGSCECWRYQGWSRCKCVSVWPALDTRCRVAEVKCQTGHYKMMWWWIIVQVWSCVNAGE